MDVIFHSGFVKCMGKQPKVELSKNINEDIDFSKVGENDMPFWVKPKVDSFK